MSDSGKFTLLAILDEKHQDWIMSLQFSPNGRYIVSGSFNYIKNDTIKCIVWTDNGIDPPIFNQELSGHTMSVNSVSFSCDGKRVATGSSDQTIRIWDTDKEDIWVCKAVLGEPNDGPNYNFIESVMFHPTDPNLLISCSSTGEVIFWRQCSDGKWIVERVIQGNE